MMGFGETLLNSSKFYAIFTSSSQILLDRGIGWFLAQTEIDDCSKLNLEKIMIKDKLMTDQSNCLFQVNLGFRKWFKTFIYNF